MNRIDELKEQVWQANLALVEARLVLLTWGNASAIDRESGVMIIKPSGVDYTQMRPEHMVLVELATGQVLEGTLRPSSDTPTHLQLYRQFGQLCGIVHTHSTQATAFAQAQREIPCLGTTHADYFYGAVPVTRSLTEEEIELEYEQNTGNVIIEHFAKCDLDPLQIPGVLVAKHGPFAWGATCIKAVENAIVLEESAQLARLTWQLEPSAGAIESALLDKHFLRKHGVRAYYGQASGMAGAGGGRN